MTTNRAITRDREDLILHVLLAAIGAIPVLIAIIERARFGVEATLGLLMVVIGLVGALMSQPSAGGSRSR